MTTDLVAEHRAWVHTWNELTLIASSGPLNLPLTEEAKDAYRLLPDVIAYCEATWSALPESERSLHPLMLRSI
jgi:hypothetical protein